ncbi:MAG: hypothetical protein IKC30_03930 [Rikenellaceae bacterium]|nr:hypothetical protein [Rikenellaceae bacterium]
MLFNALAQRQTVVLPGIGSLRFKRIAAKLEGSTLTPPRNMFRYSSREEGRSLLDMLISAAGCTREEGEEAYRRWLRRIKQGHSIVIEGVGRIEEDFFKPSDELEQLLNPVASAPFTIKRRRSWRGVWITLAAVAVIGVAGAAWWYVQMQPTSTPAVVAQNVEKTKTEVIEVAEKTNRVVAEQVATEAIPEVAPEVAPVQKESAPASAPTPAPVSTEVGEMTSGMSYVVMGVFSTEENARKYVTQLTKRAPEIGCRIYRFQGAKFMVSGFESADGAAATTFIREHRTQFPDLWAYKRK